MIFCCDPLSLQGHDWMMAECSSKNPASRINLGSTKPSVNPSSNLSFYCILSNY